MGSETIKVLDLFAGAGGLSLGFDLVRDSQGNRVFEIVKAVELDENACETLRNYFRKVYGRTDIVVQGDLTKPKLRQEIIQACKGKVSLIIGGPPCQSFSTLGPRSGYGLKDEKYRNDSRDRLYREYLKLVRAILPSFIIFENVKGIISKKDKKGRRYIDIIASDFKRLGYSFESENQNVKEEHLVLNAADYGVPQIRERVFLIGNKLGIQNPYPKQTHCEPKKAKPGNELLPWTTLHDAIRDLPRLKAKYTLTDIPKRRIKEIKQLNVRRYSGSGEMLLNEKVLAEHLNSLDQPGQQLLRFIRAGANGTILYHEARAQKEDDVRLFAGMREGTTAEHLFESTTEKARKLRRLIKYSMKNDKGEFTFGDKYRKQGWNSPSTTLFAHLAKDGNRFIHPDGKQARTFTVREAARIQTFPDWYEFAGTSRGSKFSQIGNAVPPLLAMRIAEVIHSVIAAKEGK